MRKGRTDLPITECFIAKRSCSKIGYCMGQTARYNVSDRPTSIAVRDVLLKAEEIRLLSVQKDTSPCKKAVRHVGE